MTASDHLPDFPVAVTLPVQWGDQDALSHVNNIVYFRWYESARIEYLRQIRLEVAGTADSIGLILAAISCDFRRPVTYPDTIHVAARITRIGRSSMTMEYAAYSEAQQAVAAEGSSTVVAFNYESNAPQAVSDDVRRAIEELEGKAL